jgi:hypothetical protein
MNGTRHRPGLLDRPHVLLLSVLALAFACLAGTAVAQPPTYAEDVPPSAGGGPSTEDHGPSAGDSRADTNGGGGVGPSGGGDAGGSNSGSGSSGGDSSSEKGGAAAGGSGGGTGKGSPGSISGGSAVGENGLAQSAPNTSEESGDGGSSPVVPILIAIAVLAAISMGVLLMRQRRQRGGSLSPEAS